MFEGENDLDFRPSFSIFLFFSFFSLSFCSSYSLEGSLDAFRTFELSEASEFFFINPILIAFGPK